MFSQPLFNPRPSNAKSVLQRHQDYSPARSAMTWLQLPRSWRHAWSAAALIDTTRSAEDAGPRLRRSRNDLLLPPLLKHLEQRRAGRSSSGSARQRAANHPHASRGSCSLKQQERILHRRARRTVRTLSTACK